MGKKAQSSPLLKFLPWTGGGVIGTITTMVTKDLLVLEVYED